MCEITFESERAAARASAPSSPMCVAIRDILSTSGISCKIGVVMCLRMKNNQDKDDAVAADNQKSSTP
jgi:hypothetical protein